MERKIASWWFLKSSNRDPWIKMEGDLFMEKLGCHGLVKRTTCLYTRLVLQKAMGCCVLRTTSPILGSDICNHRLLCGWFIGLSF